jgi:hypothetical protein
MTQRLTELPDDFDLQLIGDDSRLPSGELSVLRELAFRRAARDPIWFLESFWHVMDPDTFEWVLFKLRDYQVDDAHWIASLLKKKRARAVTGKARQVGQTTIATSLAFHDTYFMRNHPWLIASQGESEAIGTLAERVKEPYNRLPIWFRERGPDLLDQNSERMTFDNGSSILSIPATGKAGRSKTVYGVLMDEAAFVEDANGLFAALDPLCYGPMFVFSTGNGMGNFFHAKWVDAQLPDSEWEWRFRPWYVVPGRGPLRKTEEGQVTSAWYERERRKYRSNPWQFYQEHPSSPEEMFAKTGRAALPMDLLRDEQCFCAPKWKVNLDLGWDEKNADWRVYVEMDEADDELWVWEKPMVERDPQTGRLLRPPNYVIAADIAEGLEHGDRTSITVWNANTLECVATYRGHWPIEDLGELLNRIGRWYHDALLLPERNNQGILPIDHLRRHHEYPRMYRIGPLAAIPSGDKTRRYGWVTNKATKPLIVHEFTKALRDGEMLLHDQRFLEEAATFIADGKGGFSASGSNFDDHIMGHLIGWKGVLEVGQYPIVWEDHSTRPITFGDVMGLGEEDDTPHPMAVPIGGSPVREGTKSWTWV